MPTRRLALLLFLSLAVAGAQAQKGGGGGGGGSSKDGPVADPVHAPDTGPDNPQPKSDAERSAVADVGKVFKDPTTTPAEMDTALTSFIASYPKSDYVFSIDSLGVEYFGNDAHADGAKTLAYATAALKLSPNNLRTLYDACVAIPQHETAADPNLEVTLKLVADWDNRLIARVKLIPERGARGNETKEAIEQRNAKLKQDKDQLLYGGYVSLARVATLRKNAAEADANFAKAVEAADWEPTHTDQNRGETYLLQAQSDEKLARWSDAATALGQASKLAASAPILQQEISDEQAKIKAAGH